MSTERINFSVDGAIVRRVNRLISGTGFTVAEKVRALVRLALDQEEREKGLPPIAGPRRGPPPRVTPAEDGTFIRPGTPREAITEDDDDPFKS